MDQFLQPFHSQHHRLIQRYEVRKEHDAFIGGRDAFTFTRLTIVFDDAGLRPSQMHALYNQFKRFLEQRGMAVHGGVIGSAPTALYPERKEPVLKFVIEAPAEQIQAVMRALQLEGDE